VLVDSSYAFARSSTPNQVVTITIRCRIRRPNRHDTAYFRILSRVADQDGTSDVLARSLKANYADGTGDDLRPELALDFQPGNDLGRPRHRQSGRHADRFARAIAPGDHRFIRLLSLRRLQAGERYVLSVAAKRFTFAAARSAAAADNLAGCRFRGPRNELGLTSNLQGGPFGPPFF